MQPITTMLRKREERGRARCHVRSVDPERLGRQFAGVPEATARLEACLDALPTPDDAEVLSAVRALSAATASESSRDAVLVFGAHRQAARLLTLWPPATVTAGGDRELALQDILVFLRDNCGGAAADEAPFAGPGTVVAVFALMEVDSLFERATALAEEVLASRRRLFEVSAIPNFSRLASSRSPAQLAAYCRVLAVLCFEPEETRHLEEEEEEGAPLSSGVGLLQVRHCGAAHVPASRQKKRKHRDSVPRNGLGLTPLISCYYCANTMLVVGLLLPLLRKHHAYCGVMLLLPGAARPAVPCPLLPRAQPGRGPRGAGSAAPHGDRAALLQHATTAGRAPAVLRRHAAPGRARGHLARGERAAPGPGRGE